MGMPNNSKNGQPKIKDVADYAGVAPSTVSRVLNNPDRVSPVTLEKVNKAIEQLGFRPNILARSMRTGKTSTIAVVLPDITNLFFPELILGIEKAAQKKGYRLFICNSDEDVEREADILLDLSYRNVDGIILSSVRGENCNLKQIEDLSRQIPLVMVDRNINNLEVSSVTVDNYKGVYKATSYFLAQGYTDIAFLGGPLCREVCRKRYQGFKQALKDSGIKIQDDLIFETNFKASGGMKAAEELISKKKIPIAIVSANDMMAIGAIRVFKSRGIRIPDDIEVIGFDNIPLAALTVPSLSTVAQPIEEMGIEAVKLLFEEMKEPDRSPRRVLLETSLIHRETTRVNRKGG